MWIDVALAMLAAQPGFILDSAWYLRTFGLDVAFVGAVSSGTSCMVFVVCPNWFVVMVACWSWIGLNPGNDEKNKHVN